MCAGRVQVRELKLRSKNDWVAWCSKGVRPGHIPSRPDITYRGEGWLSWGDWLGYRPGQAAVKRDAHHFRDFKDARKFVRALDLRKKVGPVSLRNKHLLQSLSRISSQHDVLYVSLFS